MHRIASFILTAAFIASFGASGARADDVGGSGFSVPQDEWLWGVEGLVRTPVDLSVDIGVSFFGLEVDGEAQHDDGAPPASDFVRADNRLKIEPEALEGGLRIAGGLGYWNCCVLIEPAMGIRWNRPLGDERTDDTPTVRDPSEDQFLFAELEYKRGWDLAFGPQITWMVPEDASLLGPLFGGKPLVFFPYLGVSHLEWETEISAMRSGDMGTMDRNFEEDDFMIGFDIDFPLPGSHSGFTHALTFGFRWIEGDEQHDVGPFRVQELADGDTSPAPISGFCGDNTGTTERGCIAYEGTDGWRVGLYYRVTWNDFEGFFKRNIFGPAN